MRSIAGHVAVALENALAISSVEAYQRDLTRERDRLSLLLEINNHVVTILGKLIPRAGISGQPVLSHNELGHDAVLTSRPGQRGKR
jgi:hypothetical protein